MDEHEVRTEMAAAARRLLERRSADVDVMPRRDEITAEPVSGYLLFGIICLVGGVVIPIFASGAGGILLLGAVLNFVRASRAHKRNLAARAG